MPVLCCNARRRKNASKSSASDAQYKKGLLELMFAKLDEFESLTPLLTSPESSERPASLSQSSITFPNYSPPPPRRASSGRTFIVPLATNKRAAVGRHFSGDGTTKSCATIPEDDESVQSPTEAEKPEVDLISIDRTSATFSEARNIRYHSRTGIALPCAAPHYEVPTPVYAPPPVPDRYRPTLFVRSPKNFTRRDFTAVDVDIPVDNNNFSTNCMGMRKSPTCDSSTSFSSSAESSYGTNSPLDTSNSISDNIYSPIEDDTVSEITMKDSFDQEANDSLCDNKLVSTVDIERRISNKYLLHRIEEESEHNNDENECIINSDALEVSDSNIYANEFAFFEENVDFPRSVSQQVLSQVF